jgi:hypothetical protein
MFCKITFNFTLRVIEFTKFSVGAMLVGIYILVSISQVYYRLENIISILNLAIILDFYETLLDLYKISLLNDLNPIKS